MSKEKVCPNCNGTGEVDTFVLIPGSDGLTRITTSYCGRCQGTGKIPDDTPSEDEKRPRGNWVWDRLDTDLLMTIVFLLMSFVGSSQELFRFTSTSQFISVATSVVSDWQEWHTESEVYASGDMFVLVSRSESRPSTIYRDITWDIVTPRLVRGHDQIGRQFEWQKTDDRREFNGIEWITVEGENFARIHCGSYQVRFYEAWWTLTIQKR